MNAAWRESVWQTEHGYIVTNAYGVIQGSYDTAHDSYLKVATNVHFQQKWRHLIHMTHVDLVMYRSYKSAYSLQIRLGNIHEHFIYILVLGTLS
jgi:hypothetical protein